MQCMHPKLFIILISNKHTIKDAEKGQKSISGKISKARWDSTIFRRITKSIRFQRVEGISSIISYPQNTLRFVMVSVNGLTNLA